jgi:non-ribosomal peptide synthetase component F
MSPTVLQRDFPGGVPAGVPQSYVDVWVMRPSQDDDDLGDALEPVPTGDVGEICFGGGGLGFLATGYWRRDELTAEKFVDCERFGRLYRTGDVGRWHNGQLVVQGRVDRQVRSLVGICTRACQSGCRAYTAATIVCGFLLTLSIFVPVTYR